MEGRKDAPSRIKRKANQKPIDCSQTGKCQWQWHRVGQGTQRLEGRQNAP